MGYQSACKTSGDSEVADMPRVSERPFHIGMREATISPLIILKLSIRSCIACRSVPTLQEQNLFDAIVTHWRPPFIAMAHQSALEASWEGYSVTSLEFELCCPQRTFLRVQVLRLECNRTLCGSCRVRQLNSHNKVISALRFLTHGVQVACRHHPEFRRGCG